MAQRAIHLASPIVCGKGNTVSLRMAAFSKGHANLMGYSLPAVTRSDPNGRRFFALKLEDWGELTRGTVTAAMAGAPQTCHVVTDIVCSSDLAGAQVELLDGDELIFQAQI